MAVYSDITYGSVPLDVDTLTPVKKQKTHKNIIGKSLVEVEILGMETQQWTLDVTGIVYGTTTANLSTNRANLEAMDKASTYAFVDGIHNGNYFIRPGSLEFNDSGDDVGSRYKYRMVLVEE